MREKNRVTPAASATVCARPPAGLLLAVSGAVSGAWFIFPSLMLS
jgi:hypothetical protein